MTNKEIQIMKTIREIRTLLFDTNFHAVIGSEEMTNSEARKYLYDQDDQDKEINFKQEKDHVLIW